LPTGVKITSNKDHRRLLPTDSFGSPNRSILGSERSLRSYAINPSRLLRWVGSYDLTPQPSDSSLGFVLLGAAPYGFQGAGFLLSLCPLCSSSASSVLNPILLSELSALCELCVSPSLFLFLFLPLPHQTAPPDPPPTPPTANANPTPAPSPDSLANPPPPSQTSPNRS
jgi:hypothetical protein